MSTRQERMQADYAEYLAQGGIQAFSYWARQHGDDYPEDDEAKP